MRLAVCAGALCQCSFGLAPCALNVLPNNKILVCNLPLATILDKTPANLPTFGMCSSPANPIVAAATAAALGTLTPCPASPSSPPPEPPAAPPCCSAAIPRSTKLPRPSVPTAA